jgi:hypothetical protein
MMARNRTTIKQVMKIAVTAFTLFFSFLSFCQGLTFEWVRGFGGSSSDIGNAITVDASGNIYTTGKFEGTVDFDPGPGTASLTSVGADDIFIQKLDASGNFMWAKSIGGMSTDQGLSIKVDASDSVYISGVYQGTVDFDPGAGIANQTSTGSYEAFILKLDAFGNYLWAKSFGGTSSAWDLALDASGNIYTTGIFMGTGDFNPGSGTDNLSSAGSRDIFVHKMDAFGNYLWANAFGWIGDDYGYSIDTDASGNVYSTGLFLGSVDFDPGAGVSTLTSAGGNDIYIQKLDPAGNLIWAKSFGGPTNDQVRAIACDGLGNIYTSGSFEGTIDFNPDAGVSNLTSVGLYDIFVQKLDANGIFLWANSFGGPASDFSQSIGVDASDNAYTTGSFQQSVDFDPGAGIESLSSSGSHDIFVQKMDPSGYYEWAYSFGGPSQDYSESLELDIAGNIYLTGSFQQSVDFDPGVNVVNINANGQEDAYVYKMSPCTPSSGTDLLTVCDSLTWIDGNTYTSSNNTATWTLTNVAGCDSIVTLDLTVNSVSNINTSHSELTITANNSNASYVWLDCDDNYSVLPGETNQSYTASANGNYAVQLTENGCVDTSACVAITTVGIIETTFSDEFILYPNPTNGAFSIQFGSPQTNVELKIMDLSGKVIENKTFDIALLIELDLDELQGIYLIEVSNSKGERSVIRLIKL